MALQYSNQSYQHQFTANSHSLSVTIPSGLTNAVMLIVKDCNNDLPWTTFNDLTVNGSTSGVVSVGTSGNALAAVSLRAWVVVNPTPGTYNVSANFSTSSANGGMLSVDVFDLVDQTTPIADFEAGSGGSVASPLGIASLTTPTGGYALFAARMMGGSSVTPNVGTLINATNESARSYLLNGTATNFSWSGTSPTQASSIAIALTPAAGGDTTPPTITGPGGSTGSTSAVSIAENTTAVHTFTANESVTWSLNGGVDAARFTINSSTGALAFSSAPDFEAPNDSDTNNTYVVVVRATDTATPTPNTTNQTVTVTVTNVADTAGSYVISDFVNASGPPHLSGLTIDWLTFQRISDGVQVLIRTNQVTNGSADLAGSHINLVPGTAYIATGWDTAGTVSFRQFVTAT